MAERLLKIGDHVRIKDTADYAAGQVVKVIAVEEEAYQGDMTYFVESPTGGRFWPDDDELDFSLAHPGEVVLSAEQAAQVRSALAAIGWDRDDLGPLAAPEKPKRHVSPHMTLPYDDFDRGMEDIKNYVEAWGGTFEY